MDKEKKRILKMKPSAYKSMMLGKLNMSDSTPQKKKDLIRWKNEKWENLSARITDGDKFYACGQKGKKQIKKDVPSVCRPSVKINNKTPKPLSKNITDKQIKKAIDIKKKGGTIKWSEL
jgi:hypothetical protein